MREGQASACSLPYYRFQITIPKIIFFMWTNAQTVVDLSDMVKLMWQIALLPVNPILNWSRPN